MIPTISIRRAMLTRLVGPVSTLIVCILICYEGVVITKSYSNKIDRRNQYESNLRHRKLLQERVGSSNEYTQHNEYTYVDDNEEVNSNDEVDDPLSYEYDNCIVGSGLSGAIIAEQYATKYDQSSLIIEKRNHIGGNLYDYVDDNTGIRVNAYGSKQHLLNTDNERVWEYVQQFATWIPYEQKKLGFVNKNVQVPLNVDTVSEMFDSKRLDTSTLESKSRISRLLFGNTDVSEATQETSNEHEVQLTKDKEEGYIPQDGYTALFNNILDNDKITVVTNTNYFDVKDQLQCQRLYYSGPIDAYFEELNWSKLEYKSVSFDRVSQEGIKDEQSTAAVLNHDEELSTEDVFTRIVEYKDVSDQASDASVYFIERDTDEGEPYYPVQSVEKQQRNIELYNRYKEMAEKENGVTFIGGLANYKHFSMEESECYMCSVLKS